MKSKFKKKVFSQRAEKSELALRLKEKVDKKMPLVSNLKYEFMSNLGGGGIFLLEKYGN